MKQLLMAATIAAGALYLCGTPAKASNLLTLGNVLNVTGYQTPDSFAFNAALTDGYSYYTGPITLDIDLGGGISTTVTVFCADLNHELHAGLYQVGLLTEDGHGNPITQTLSNLLGHIAAYGLANGGEIGVAAQALIWDKEYAAYGVNTTFYDPTAGGDYTNLVNNLLSTFTNDGLYDIALIPYGSGLVVRPNCQSADDRRRLRSTRTCHHRPARRRPARLRLRRPPQAQRLIAHTTASRIPAAGHPCNRQDRQE